VSSSLIGFAGVVVGVLLTVLLQAWQERERRKWETIVWRREHALAAASDLLQAVPNVAINGRTAVDLQAALEAARAAGQVQEVRQLEAQLEGIRRQRDQVATEGGDALSRLSLLVSQETYLACSDYFLGVMQAPHRIDTAGVGAHVNNLLRADLGLPERKIAKGQGITAEEYRTKVEQLRRQQAP
jgi:hypothetical protein